MSATLESGSQATKTRAGVLRLSEAKPLEPIKVRRIVACVDGSPFSGDVVSHALRIASALDAELTLLRVIEAPTAAPLDPVAWDMRVREARDEVERLAAEHRSTGRVIAAEVIEGDAAEQIRQWVRRKDVDLTVIATHGARGVTDWGMGSTARKLLNRVPGSLLVVPVHRLSGGAPVYRTVLVPLDGSSHAESVLQLAETLAEGDGGRIVLAHIVPVPELTEAAPIEAEGRELREKLVRRNRRVAEAYLTMVRTRVSGDVQIRTAWHEADVRGGLAAIIAGERPDVVVLSAHGHGRRSDVPYGNVTGYLLDHADAPLLIVRGRKASVVRADAAPDRLSVHAGG